MVKTMEYPNFLSFDGLEDAERHEIGRILFDAASRRKVVVEFSITFEKKSRRNQVVGNPFAYSGSTFVAGFNPTISPAIPTLLIGGQHFALRQDGLLQALPGGPIYTGQTGYHVLSHSPAGTIHQFLPFHSIHSSVPMPMHPPPQFVFSPAAIANLPQPYHPNMPPPHQPPMQHNLMSPPQISLQPTTIVQPCVKNGDAENEPASNSTKIQVPVAADGESQPILLPSATSEDAEINGDQTEEPPMSILPSDMDQNAGTDGVSAENIDQVSDQEPLNHCEIQNGPILIPTSDNQEVVEESNQEMVEESNQEKVEESKQEVVEESKQEMVEESKQEMVEESKQEMVEESTSNAQQAAIESQNAQQKTEEIKPTKEVPKKSWASLFQNTRQAKQAIVTTAKEKYYDAASDDVALQIAIQESARDIAAVKIPEPNGQLGLNDIWVPVDHDPPARYLADALKRYRFVDKGPAYAIRGISNRGNWCYANATLQALMACPTFFHFLRQLYKDIKQRLPSSTPLLDSCTRLATELTLVKDLGKVNLKGQSVPPLDLSFMHSIICQLKTDSSFKGRQEDAEEFLLFVLNRLHEEMVAVLGLTDKAGQQPRTTNVNESSEASMGSSEWHQVGAGKKVAVTRQINVAQSPILHIFAGQLRYGLTRPGAKESANLEPFFTLPLDVLLSNVHSIQSALRAFTTREIVKNIQGNDKTEMDATRHITFYELPRILILQLKYFEFTEQGVKKNIKPIDYSMDLMIGPDLLSAQSKIPPNERQYKLFAVVFHHGDKAEGGHYTVDIYNAGHWTNIDDTKTSPVKSEHVLSFQPPRVPYLLFYRRFEADHSLQRRSDNGNNQKR